MHLHSTDQYMYIRFVNNIQVYGIGNNSYWLLQWSFKGDKLSFLKEMFLIEKYSVSVTY